MNDRDVDELLEAAKDVFCPCVIVPAMSPPLRRRIEAAGIGIVLGDAPPANEWWLVSIRRKLQTSGRKLHGTTLRELRETQVQTGLQAYGALEPN